MNNQTKETRPKAFARETRVASVVELKKKTENKTEENKEIGKDTKTEELSEEKKDKNLRKDEVKKALPEKKQKTKIEVNANSLRISTKHSMAICKFIKNKKIQEAIFELQQVVKLKRAIPMRGEIPHRRGKIMSGRFPKKASEEFIKVLKNASAVSSNEGLDNPIIIEAISNRASRPYGRFGRIRRKRTHVKIIAGIKQNKKL